MEKYKKSKATPNIDQNQLQQGDVMILAINESSLPVGERKNLKNGTNATLALGEHTGHHHTAYADDVGQLDQFEINGRTFIRNNGKKPVNLVHQEHKPIAIPPGLFEYGIVEEVDHVNQIRAAVVD